jgi:hypothetical protein
VEIDSRHYRPTEVDLLPATPPGESSWGGRPKHHLSIAVDGDHDLAIARHERRMKELASRVKRQCAGAHLSPPSIRYNATSFSADILNWGRKSARLLQDFNQNLLVHAVWSAFRLSIYPQLSATNDRWNVIGPICREGGGLPRLLFDLGSQPISGQARATRAEQSPSS